MDDFNKGIVVVTHGHHLIEHCDCKFWVVERWFVTKWTAGFEDNKSIFLQEMEERIGKENALCQKQVKTAADVRAKRFAVSATCTELKKQKTNEEE